MDATTPVAGQKRTIDDLDKVDATTSINPAAGGDQSPSEPSDGVAHPTGIEADSALIGGDVASSSSSNSPMSSSHATASSAGPPVKKSRVDSNESRKDEGNNDSDDEDEKWTPPATAATEAGVGITTFLGSASPWKGIIKQRYSDFLVNEVSLDGQVVHLTDTETLPVDVEEHQFYTPVQSAAALGSSGSQPQQQQIESQSVTASGPPGGDGENKTDASATEEAETETEPKEPVDEEARKKEALGAVIGSDQAERVFKWIEEVKNGTITESSTGTSAEPAATENEISSASSRGGRGGGRRRGRGRGSGSSAAGSTSSRRPTLRLDPDTDKSHRTQVHAAFRQVFSGMIATETDGEVIVVIFVGGGSGSGKGGRGGRGGRGGGSGGGGGGQVRKVWPKERGNYLRFVLYKENKDTTQALNAISKLVRYWFLIALYLINQINRMRAHYFTYAGTKDKRGITVQHMTVYRLEAERLRSQNRQLYGMRVGNFTYVKEPLALGQLYGNRFDIVLRDVQAEDEIIESSLKQLEQTGFINYFGMQRFGTSAISTHHVGIQLLRSRWKTAVTRILQPRPGEDSNSQAAREHWMATKNPQATVRKLSRHMTVERLLLQGLIKNPKGFLNAFMTLPRNLRTMYGHSYQSYIWNQMASLRVKVYGANRPVAGDLVLLKDIDATADDLAEEEEGDATTATNSEAEDTGSEKSLETDASKQSGETEKEKEKEQESDTLWGSRPEVKVLTAEEAESGKYSIEDVVMPLPGYCVTYPGHDVGEAAYVEAMAVDGVTPEMLKHRVKDLRLPGSYRKIIQRAADLQWSILHYDDNTVPLSLTDRDRIEGRQLQTNLEGKLKAVRVSFTLRSSTYATMCLREMMKLSSDDSCTRFIPSLSHKFPPAASTSTEPGSAVQATIDDATGL